MRSTTVAPILILFFYALAYGATLPLAPMLLLSNYGYLLPETAPLSQKLFYISIAYTLHPLFMFLGTSYLSNLSDILNRKKAFLIASGGLFLVYLCTSATIAAHSLIGYLTLRALSGIFRGTKPVVMAAIADRAAPEERADAIRKADLGYVIGFSIGPFIGGFLANPAIHPSFCPALSYLFSAIVSAISLIWIACSFQNTISSTQMRKFSWNETMLTFAEGLKFARTRFLIPQIIFYELSSVLYFITMVITLRTQFHYTSSKIGLVMGCQGLVYLLTGATILRTIAQRLRSIPATLISLCLLATLFLVQSLFLTEIALLLLFLPIHALFQTCNTLMYNNASVAAGRKYQGWAMGLVSGSVALAWVIGGSQSSLFEGIGSSGMMQIASGATLISFAFLLAHRRQLRAA